MPRTFDREKAGTHELIVTMIDSSGEEPTTRHVCRFADDELEAAKQYAERQALPGEWTEIRRVFWEPDEFDDDEFGTIFDAVQVDDENFLWTYDGETWRDEA